MLPLPVVFRKSARTPTAVLLLPVALEARPSQPTAVFFTPMVLVVIASQPMAVLLKPGGGAIAASRSRSRVLWMTGIGADHEAEKRIITDSGIVARISLHLVAGQPLGPSAIAQIVRSERDENRTAPQWRPTT